MFECIQICPELDCANEPHCKSNETSKECPCGNTPVWSSMRNKMNISIIISALFKLQDSQENIEITNIEILENEIKVHFIDENNDNIIAKIPVEILPY